ncbi:CRAL/TRIO domain-containing protein [Epithele typhae]|uniref:CRAL/TRIO domain-containing protein n=1 Tax=Epithele typhae TaxID=378194 RepID=UPI0020078DA8|nr:CRAL/TRIO domain-containing protein [Epithele typhae]KAH9929563.1 CRAL/TRIO domain-containing protein [Epithele typhae]
MKAAIHKKEKQFAESYATNLADARHLQRTLEDDILPGMADELGLDGAGEQRALQWLHDLQSIFRLLRRHKFTSSFALENARDVLLWRLAIIPPTIPRPIPTFMQCLPLDSLDPFGRPIVVIKLTTMLESSADVRTALIQYIETLRRNLVAMNLEKHKSCGKEGDVRPILQYVALVDIGGISVQSVSVELLTWFVYELIPRFPGMLAALLILNYSWAHAGLWSIVKRVLPKSALARIFFPTEKELLEYLSPAVIPQDYGGNLLPLSQLEDPLENFMVDDPGPADPDGPSRSSTNSSAHDLPVSEQPKNDLSRVPSMSPTSHLNPYFGYPVSAQGAPTPRLRHGRQRKRDLVRTLVLLWWDKWKDRATVLLCVALLVMSFRLRRHPSLVGWRQGVWALLRLPVRPRP